MLASFTYNLSISRAKTKRLNGREYLVAPLTLIVPGVLAGSRGPMLYPPEELAKNPKDWEGKPIVVEHPMRNGKPISANKPGVIEQQGIGTVVNPRIRNGKLVATGWFDVQRTRRIDNSILQRLTSGQPIELSTGLLTDTVPYAGRYNGRDYEYIARGYEPDHLAILPDRKGACSIDDGCGVLMNALDASATPQEQFHERQRRWARVHQVAAYYDRLREFDAEEFSEEEANELDHARYTRALKDCIGEEFQEADAEVPEDWAEYSHSAKVIYLLRVHSSRYATLAANYDASQKRGKDGRWVDDGIDDDNATIEDVVKAAGGLALGLGGAVGGEYAGAAIGGAIGSFIAPGPGTAVGGAIGGAIGAALGSLGGAKLAQVVGGESAEAGAEVGGAFAGVGKLGTGKMTKKGAQTIGKVATTTAKTAKRTAQVARTVERAASKVGDGAMDVARRARRLKNVTKLQVANFALTTNDPELQAMAVADLDYLLAREAAMPPMFLNRIEVPHFILNDRKEKPPMYVYNNRFLTDDDEYDELNGEGLPIPVINWAQERPLLAKCPCGDAVQNQRGGSHQRGNQDCDDSPLIAPVLDFSDRLVRRK